MRPFRESERKVFGERSKPNSPIELVLARAWFTEKQKAVIDQLRTKYRSRQ